uniref:Uncharacterized protein n=1 Tax=Leersia perrieri TaxID=77586 RepID=A0A0D9XBC5_9ORYZ
MDERTPQPKDVMDERTPPPKDIIDLTEEDEISIVDQQNTQLGTTQLKDGINRTEEHGVNLVDQEVFYLDNVRSAQIELEMFTAETKLRGRRLFEEEDLAEQMESDDLGGQLENGEHEPNKQNTEVQGRQDDFLNSMRHNLWEYSSQKSMQQIIPATYDAHHSRAWQVAPSCHGTLP